MAGETYVLTLWEEGSLPLSLDDGDELMWGLGEYGPGGSGDFPYYDGSYEADALFEAQVFPTKRRVMADDFTVRAINYTEAPNDYGTTVTIGG